MTEIQKVKAEIKMLEKKLSFLEELERTKTPVEEAYKKVYGVYPTNEITYNSMWGVFQKGYYAAQEDYKVGEYQEDVVKEVKKLQEKDWTYKIADEHGETNPYKQYLNSVENEKKMEELGFVKNSDGSWTARPLGETAQERGERVHKEMEETIKIHDGYGVVDVKTNWKPKPQTHEEVSDGLKKAFREAIKQGIIPEVDKVSEVFMNEMVAELKGQTLTDIIWNWWGNVFTSNEDWDAENAIEHLVDLIEAFLPKPQNSAGSQNAYVESAVEGFNDAIKQIKSKLR